MSYDISTCNAMMKVDKFHNKYMRTILRSMRCRKYLSTLGENTTIVNTMTEVAKMCKEVKLDESRTCIQRLGIPCIRLIVLVIAQCENPH